MYFLSKPTKLSATAHKARVCFFNSLMKDNGDKQLKRWATVQKHIYLATEWPIWNYHCDIFLAAYKTTDSKAKAMVELHRIN